MSCEMSRGMMAHTTAATNNPKLVASFGFVKMFKPEEGDFITEAMVDECMNEIVVGL